MTRRVDTRSDEGAVLVLALAFLGVFGIVVAGLLAQSDVSLRNTGAVEDLSRKAYAADSGLDAAIEAVQTTPTLCADPALGEQVISPGLVVDPATPPVVLRCRATAGAATGVLGYAVYTTSTGGRSLRTDLGNDKAIDGAVHVAGGLDLGKPLQVRNGSLLHTGSPCLPASAVGTLGPPSVSLQVTPDPPYRYLCQPGASNPTVDLPLPPRPTAVRDPAGVTTSGCTVFEPGVYTSAPLLGDNNYFRSGVYAFRDIGVWQVQQANVVAGRRGDEPRLTSAIPCATETTGDGFGALFVLEGASSIQLRNQSALEVFSRRATADGPPGVSVQVPTSTAGGWAPRPSSLTTPVLDIATGADPELTVHGSLVAPSAPVVLFATNSTVAQVRNGVVAATLELRSSASASGLGVAVATASTVRRLTLTAMAPGAPGERTVTASAVVEVANDAGRTVSVLSRRTD